MTNERLFEVVSALEAISEPSQVQPQLQRIARAYGLKSISYVAAGASQKAGEEPYVAATYSPEWIQHYRAKRYLTIDPVVQVGMRRLLPVDWREFGELGKKVQEFFGESVEFGLGRQGLTVPVHGSHGDRALLSITSDLSEREWKFNRKIYSRDFQVLAFHAHARLVGREDVFSKRVALSPRERECLAWTAEGKTVWECGVILGLSPYTVRCYLESARHKLAASSNTQAVAKALRFGLLSPIP